MGTHAAQVGRTASRERLVACIVVILCAVILSGCGEIVEPGESVTIQDAEAGLVGVPFTGGVECLGEEARPITADTVYVSPSGDDTNRGDTRDAPLGTLAQAFCNARPGQTVIVMQGTYEESVVMGAFGDESAAITIRGEGADGSLPLMDGGGWRTAGIILVECENVVIEGIEFRNYSDAGLDILVGSGMTVRNNRFIDNGRASIDPEKDNEGYGVNIVGVNGVLVEGNEAAGNGPGPEGVREFNLGTGINTFELGDATIRDNYSHDNIGGGILVEDGSGVVVTRNRIERNELDANGDYWDGGIWVDGGNDITLSHNNIEDNHGPGIVLSDEDRQSPAGYRISNNYISGNIVGVYIWNFGRCPFPAPETITIDANDLEGNGEGDFWCKEWV